VVDDDPVVRMLARRAVAALGFDVIEAEDGPGAIRAVDRSRPDFILLDVEMPDLDGFETCEALRQRGADRDIPIVIVTGHTDAATMMRAFEVGATDFATKPVDWKLLQHRIRFLMRAYDAFGELRETLADLRDSQQRLANAQRLARLGHWEWIAGESDMLWSDEVYRILGLDQRPGVATLPAFLAAVHPEDRPALEKLLLTPDPEPHAWALEHRIVLASGEERCVQQEGERSRAAPGGIERIAGTIQDVTERRRAEEQIRFLAYYDGLTALPNRRMLATHLGRTLEWAAQGRHKVALLLLDLDRFQRINDNLGHETGDDLLCAVAQRLLSCVRTNDLVSRVAPEGALVSRLGGDEFSAVIKGIGSAEDAAQVARRLLEALRVPFPIRGNELVMSASVGISLFPEDGSDAEVLLRKADAAMRHAKSCGQDSFQFFAPHMNETSMRKLRLESRLREALDREELRVVYQPQLDLRTGSISGAEALVRWDSPELGMLLPAEFVPVAEETGLIERLGEWVLRTACKQRSGWERSARANLRLAVNVSLRQLLRPGLVEVVQQALRDSRMEARSLELEITETALLSQEPAVVETLERLSELGVQLALDDFGTGYSSLSHLVRFPIDILKVDKTFVSDIGSGGPGKTIVAAVIAMGHRLGLRVVAEGVETEQEVEFLRAQGCDAYQGFLLADPLEGERLSAWIRARDAESGRR
jgi:diguanylate cyclase (GGDEF)-like protein